MVHPFADWVNAHALVHGHEHVGELAKDSAAGSEAKTGCSVDIKLTTPFHTYIVLMSREDGDEPISCVDIERGCPASVRKR